jgi:class 3 adenylate cyclase
MAALPAHRALAAATWEKIGSLCVRMGLHTGDANFGRATITGR